MTASGAISEAAPVMLNSDGTVTAVSGSTSFTQSTGSSSTFLTGSGNSNGLRHIRAAYDSTYDKHVIVCRDMSDGNYPVKAVVASSDGNTLTYGDPVQVSTQNAGEPDIQSIGSGKVIIHIKDFEDNSKGKVAVGTISGTSISIGTFYDYGDFAESEGRIAYCPHSGYFVAAWDDDNNNGESRVGSISGTTISYGTEVAFESDGGNSMGVSELSLAHVGSSKVVVCYRNRDGSNNKHQYCRVGTISGTSISWGSRTQILTGTGVWGAKHSEIAYDEASDRVVVSFLDETNSDYPVVMIGTVSGTSISFGTKVVVSSNVVGEASQLEYHTGAEKTYIAYTRNNDSSNGYINEISVSGTSATIGSDITFTVDDSRYKTIGISYNSTSQNMLIANPDDGTSPYGGSARIFTPAFIGSNYNASNVIGLAAKAIANSAAGDINLFGGIATSSSFVEATYTGSAGSKAVFEAASTEHYGIAFDSSNNKVVVAYKDEGNSNYGTAVVGTISGTSISWGSPVVFEEAAMTYPAVSFDSSSNKIAIFYNDGGNSEYGTAIVGTVSGTSISFGSATVFNAGTTQDIDATFDSNSNKHVITYRDNGNNGYGTAIVGTISGTSISFGSETVFASVFATYTALDFDSSAYKVVVAYRDATDSLNYGKGIVGTVSGTSISFGSAVTFESAQVSGMDVAYDSNRNKTLVTYSDNGNSGYSTAVVGTVSGTSITFSSPVVWDTTGYASNTQAVYDSNANRFLVFHDVNMGGGTYHGAYHIGSISSAGVFSAGMHTTFETGGYPGYLRGVFDSSQNSVVLVFKDGSNSNYGTGIAFQLSGTSALTIGSDYYVQSDGTISTTSTSPAVLLGQAISTTTINMRNLT